jgi:hypothetical protein
MFAKRYGHYSQADFDNRSPVFLQFLDCVHQIWHEMCCEFEFNDKLLVFIAEEVQNCKYGDFFFNCESERIKNEVRDKTFSVWTTIELHKDDYFRNPSYVGSLENMSRIQQVPVLEYHKLRFWREYFCRYSESKENEEDYMPDAQ